jgi:hypothetical protein
MLLYKKINLFAGFLLFLLFGCGYSPLIDLNQTNSFMLNKGQFIIFYPKNDIDFHVREKLLSDFGFPKNPKYRIELENKLVRKKSIVTEKNDITRYNLILNSYFKLKEIKTNNAVLLKKFNSEISFSASISITGFKTEVAKENAEKRLAYDVAEKIRNEILIFQKGFTN